jgi:hypothetical protein
MPRRRKLESFKPDQGADMSTNRVRIVRGSNGVLLNVRPAGFSDSETDEEHFDFSPPLTTSQKQNQSFLTSTSPNTTKIEPTKPSEPTASSSNDSQTNKQLLMGNSRTLTVGNVTYTFEDPKVVLARKLATNSQIKFSAPYPAYPGERN